MAIDLYENFLQLVRLGIGHDAYPQSANLNWEAIKSLADVQGLTAVVLDGINSRGKGLEDKIPLQLKLEWIGEVLQNYEQRYKAYENAIGTLAAFYSQHGYKMMVLKGFACSLDWPNTKCRPCGDIDIWLFGKQKEADEELAAWFKIQGSKARIDTSHHHHTVFEWQGFTVENHYDFVNVHAHRSSKELEVIFKKLGQNDSRSMRDNGENVYVPSPNLHALFLIRHMANHFASAEINLRQVLDWAFFVEKHTHEIDWKWLVDVLDKYHMHDFYNCINAICVGDLGFDVKIFPNVQFDPTLKDKVFKDIIAPEYGNNLPKGFANRLLFKYRRWKANAWKQELCYGESRSIGFWSGVKSHLLKPKTI